MKADLIFTLDYEMFGDGSGSAIREQCVPTAHLANILEINDARLTIFVEVGQLIYFRKHGIEEGYAPVEAQLLELAVRGHDIQLHIHPMWFFSSPPRDRRPNLDPDKYDLSLLDQADIERIVGESCTYLRQLIAPVVPGYGPTAFRAGAWSMKDHLKLFPILAANGIRIDSTIAPGGQFSSGYGAFDYRTRPMHACWNEGPLLEIPILTASRPFSAVAYLNPYGLEARRIVGSIYKEPLARIGSSKFRRLVDFLTRTHLMADFNTLDAKQLAGMVSRHVERHHQKISGAVPVVLIGHSKTSYFSDRIHTLFHLLYARGIEVRGRKLSDYAGNETDPGRIAEPDPMSLVVA